MNATTSTEKRESSVLFSLRELKGLAEDRVREEEEEARALAVAAEAARQAELERSRREAEDARAVALRAEHARSEAALAQRREDALRLEEAERRARVDAQAQLDAERMRLEMAAQSQLATTHRKPKGLVAIAGVLAIAVAGAGLFAYQKSVEGDSALARAEAAATDARIAGEKAAAAAAALAASQAEQAELRKQLDAAVKARAAATTEAEKAAADIHIKKLQSQSKAIASRPAPPAATPKIDLCPPNQPLCNR